MTAADYPPPSEQDNDVIIYRSTPNLLASSFVTIAAGAELRFDYSFELPVWLPPSFLIANANVQYGIVVKGKVAKKAKTATVEKRVLPLDVYDHTPPSITSSGSHKIDKVRLSSVLPWWLRSKGHIDVSLSAPDRMHIGTSARFRVLVRMPQFFANGGKASKLKLELRLALARNMQFDESESNENICLSRVSLQGSETMRGLAPDRAGPEAAGAAKVDRVTVSGPDQSATLPPPSLQDTYDPVDSSGLQHLWEVDFELPNDPSIFTMQSSLLSQECAVVFEMCYGSRRMQKMSQPVVIAGYFAAGPSAPPITPQ